jgi:cell division transport system permease protein
MMQKKQSTHYILKDIPLEQESSRRHLPILMCLLVFLLIIILTVVFSIEDTLLHYQSQNQEQTLNEQNIAIEIIHSQKSNLDINHIAQLLPKTPGITSFKVIPENKKILFLKSYSDDIKTTKDLKKIILIELNIDQTKFNINETKQLLHSLAPDIHITSYTKKPQNQASLISSLRIISYSIIGAIIFSILTIVSVTTRASLNIHKHTIDVLRLMGARNRYIASYFQNSSFYLCLKGALLGLIIAIPTIVLFKWLYQRLSAATQFTLETPLWLWLLILSTPFIISFLAMLVSRLSVIRTLIRLNA